MISNEIIQQIIKKYLANECSQDEKDLLENWYLNTAKNATDPLDLPDYFAVQSEILNNLKKQQGRDKTISAWWLSAAAVVLVTLAAGFYFYINSNPPSTQQKEKKIIFAQEINPGENKAYLTLSNGKRITLTDNADEELATQAGIKVTKTRDGQLVYTSIGGNTKSGSNLFNKIEAPTGGQYQLVLPDGTKIWLNSATSLKYPVSFDGLKERKVELNGEAYFEVAHLSSKPFLVVTNKQTITVLGTHFNVNAYTDEPTTKTSLLEGSVKISTQKDANPQLLKPGQQAILKEDRIHLKNVDVQQTIAWKNGDFVFNGENLQGLMREIARWYNVEIIYKGEIPSSTGFVSTISRKKKITEILKAIELNQNVKFKIEGREVTVMP